MQGKGHVPPGSREGRDSRVVDRLRDARGAESVVLTQPNDQRVLTVVETNMKIIPGH